MASSIVFAATPATGFLSVPPLKARRFYVCSSLDNDVSDMSVKAPEPVTYKGPKLKVAIMGAGLAGMSTAVELLDQGHEDGREEIIQAWYMDDSEEDQRLRFHKDPKEFVSLDKLAEIDKLIGWTSKFLAWLVIVVRAVKTGTGEVESHATDKAPTRGSSIN